MRHKASWTDCFPLEIYWTWIVAGVIAAVITLVTQCAPTPAHAEAYLDVAGGFTRFLVTAQDGDYLQKDLPHDLDLSAVAYKVGLGWRFNERWSVQGAYINLGTLKQDARFVHDPDYDPKANKCLANCAAAVPNKITDAYHGGELTVTRSFHPSVAWGLHVKAGGAYLMHRQSITRFDTAGFHENYGQFLATVAGAGVSYKWAYVEVDYYHGLGGSNGFMGQDQGWPLSKEMLVTWFGVKIPIGG